ncbi:hypothetical protein [Rarobacter incanus]|uniref:Pilus assembly protein CpaB n=1 Tax=Rarobacter incanus TaxID=153494 RepID=A0A542SPS0_9MICO|nr:hypothetical protein [Rarobacter incanus]TQK76582.1 hypothetical protein FB389_1266 [Rarobacter incanus]
MKPRLVRSLVVMIAALATIGIASCSSSYTNELSADWPHYSTLPQALSAADAVIVGKTLSSRESLLLPESTAANGAVANPGEGTAPSPDEIGGSAVPITIATVEVIESIKGSLPPGTTIEIGQPGTKAQREVSTVLLEDIDAAEMVLLLSAYESSPYSLISPESGVMPLAGERITALKEPAGSSSTPLASDLEEIRNALRDKEGA